MSPIGFPILGHFFESIPKLLCPDNLARRTAFNWIAIPAKARQLERQGRDRNNTQEDSSDRFRTTYRHRNREYSLRESEVKTLIEVGRFRVIPADDLGGLGYRGDRTRMESDVQNLRRQGLIEQRSIEGYASYS